MKYVEQAASTSDGRSRRCKDCMFWGYFPQEICRMCSKAYKEGFVKGVNWGNKHKK